MSINALVQSIDRFAALVVDLQDEQLDLPWTWRDYDSDGVRFAYFRTLEELRSLAVELSVLNAAAGAEPFSARLIMNQYHRAWRAMHAMLLGTGEDDREQIPAPDEWHLRRVIAHIVDADVGFYTIVSETLKSLRAGSEPPHGDLDQAWEQITRDLDDDYKSLIKGPNGPVFDLDRRMHDRILDEFSGISEEELESPSYYWEASAYTLRFRLGRFESHCRQHTVQLYKTRVAIGRFPTESQLMLGEIYAALAEVENAHRTLPRDPAEIGELADLIEARTGEVRTALG